VTPTIADLLATVPTTGHLDAILVRPRRDQEAQRLDEAQVVAGLGIVGDRRARGEPDPDGRRHVTLIQAEHLDVLTRLLDRPVVAEQTRRNLVVSGINLLALADRRFTAGDVVLEGTGLCHPCSQMEARLGLGGYQAMRGHGGITARAVTGGALRIGAAVVAPPIDGDAAG
jgi:MOSC domain-containing protein YiiM